ncbi:MAG: cold-shock protein [Pseudomonadota bacterium]|nr:cold-shock protein [Pseudomonadota bacterium]
METGIVKWFNETKGYGFIKPDSGDQDVFVHISAVRNAGMQTLQEDQRVQFEVEAGSNGKTSAVNLKEL